MSLLLLFKFPRSSSVTATTQVAVDCTSPVLRVAAVAATTQVAVDCTSPVVKALQYAATTQVAVGVESEIGKVLQLEGLAEVAVSVEPPKGVKYAANTTEVAVDCTSPTNRAQNVASTTSIAVDSTSPSTRVANVVSETSVAVGVESVVVNTERTTSTGDAVLRLSAPSEGYAIFSGAPVAGFQALYSEDRGPIRPEVIVKAIKNRLVATNLFPESCVFVVTNGSYFSPIPPGDRYAVIYTGDGGYDQSHLAGAGVESNLANDTFEIRVFIRQTVDRYTRADTLAASQRFSALRLARAVMRQLQIEDLRTSTNNVYLLAQPMRCTRKPRVEHTQETDFASASVAFEVLYTLDVTSSGLAGAF